MFFCDRSRLSPLPGMIHGTAGHHLSRGWWHHGKGKASRRSKRPVVMWKCDEHVMKVALSLPWPWQHYLILKKRVTSVRRIIERGIAGIVTVEAPWFLDYFVVWALAIPQSRYPQQGTQYSTQTSLLFGTGRSSMIQGFLGEGTTCQPCRAFAPPVTSTALNWWRVVPFGWKCGWLAILHFPSMPTLPIQYLILRKQKQLFIAGPTHVKKEIWERIPLAVYHHP